RVQSRDYHQFKHQNLRRAVICVELCSAVCSCTLFTSIGSKLNVCHAPVSNGSGSDTFRHWGMLKMSHSKPFILTTSCWILFVVRSEERRVGKGWTNFRYEWI